MSGGFYVDHTALAAKSKQVEAVAGPVRDCKDASETVGVGGLIYGVIFDPTALPILNSAQNNYTELIGTAADVGDSIAQGLQSNANSYQAAETALQEAIDKMNGEVENVPNPGGPYGC
ncbi:type VII secretion target [Nocardioides sp. Root151]|uniref:type VII secretion target n=1 Tax=Nocardioides sp. Root151 TaxID=1736475 RepID=UPI00070378CE|nr:hypothetical protein [Nocardioides sp. Root151]KQZ67158.1 hypothetical protein ASD66_19415 [Nocardioides sp. Root151]